MLTFFCVLTLGWCLCSGCVVVTCAFVPIPYCCLLVLHAAVFLSDVVVSFTFCHLYPPQAEQFGIFALRGGGAFWHFGTLFVAGMVD